MLRRFSASGFMGLAFAAALVVSISCGGSDSPGGTGPTPDPVVVVVTPARDTLTVSTAAAFSATVTGTSNTAVSWSVQEGASAGSVSPAGLFTASATPGTRHVIAASQESATGKDTAVVLVVAAPVATITAPAAVGHGGGGARGVGTGAVRCHVRVDHHRRGHHERGRDGRRDIFGGCDRHAHPAVHR